MAEFRNVILGGGVAAAYAAREYAERGGEPGTLAVVTAEDRAPYDRPPLSKRVLQGEMEPGEAMVEDAGFYAEHGIELSTGTRVVAVDLENRRLEAADGREIGWESLLVATGSRVLRLDVPGGELGNVFTLRTAGDADRILGALEDAERAVVVGGGFIGTEVAASIRQRGLDVALVFREERLLQGRPLAPEMSEQYASTYRDRGVELLSGETVVRFEGAARVERVMLESGRELEADLVVVGIGVVPETRLFEGSAVEVDDGIVVDENLRTAVDGVYAAGDVARWPDPVFGKRRRIEHWDNAAAQGRHWARSVLGEPEPFVHLPYFFSDAFDLSWEYWGDREEGDDLVYRGEVASGSYSAWWLAGERVVAAFVMDRPAEEGEAAMEWIESGESVDRGRLRDEERSLIQP
ncbi:MAG: FAD-dependent oxidoreductase [Gemmatimonadota bacterium]|nr:FAD-dependent oxidoreductase [Gemmatimonadota bacterium]